MAKKEVPIWEKANLTLEEAAAYFNIGINKMRRMTDSKECERFIIWDGNRRLIKRVLFEDFLNQAYSI